MNLTAEKEETIPQTGPELRALREKAGIQHQVMALALGIDRSTLSQREGGFKPVTAEFAKQYDEAVKRIFRDRAEALGLEVRDPEQEVTDGSLAS